MSKVDGMCSKKTEGMKFWTKEEYKAFSRELMDKDASFLLFELLYWLGICSGEALALMPQDFDFKRNRVSITKTYVGLNGKDVFNPPKTKKSVRTIVMPQFLADEVQDYLIAYPFIKPDDRLTNATKSFLAHEMERGCKQAGVKRILIHDLRHSHVSLLIEMGFSALAIAEKPRPREHRGDHDVRASFPEQAGGNGGEARNRARAHCGNVLRGSPCDEGGKR